MPGSSGFQIQEFRENKQILNKDDVQGARENNTWDLGRNDRYTFKKLLILFVLYPQSHYDL